MVRGVGAADVTYEFCSVTESEPQPNFCCPNARRLLSIGCSKDTQTATEKVLFQAVQPG
jgi:hypothetical protein